MSQIQWTDATWNPVIGCTPVSQGCRNCYAAVHARRMAGNPKTPYYEGLAHTVGGGRVVFSGVVRLMEDRLEQPLRWRKSRRVFVNSMSDLFHPDVPFWFVDRVFAVMALASQHTFQILTKRPERAAEYLLDDETYVRIDRACRELRPDAAPQPIQGNLPAGGWPLPNAWLGTSVEDQAAADERIPHLLQCPAAVRFLSCEPLLGPVDLFPYLDGAWANEDAFPVGTSVDWVIVGGESGAGARPCDVNWIRGIVRQCRDADVPVFVKQLGARPYQRGPVITHHPWILRDPKGGDWSEWPGDLRVRFYPEVSP